MTLGVGLIGFGLAGRHLHAPVIAAAGMEIRAIVSSREEEIRADWPGAEIVADADALLARDDIELAVVVTPNHLHHAQVGAALEAGKHVVVDKPFALTSAEAGDLIALADRKVVRLSVYHNRRWDSDFLTIRKLVDAGRLGNVIAFQMRWDRWRPAVIDRWREHDMPGGGMLLDLGPHMIDQAIQLMGRPDWIMADVFGQRPGTPVDDAAEILMGRGRQRIMLGISMLAADGSQRYRVHGTEGSFVKSGLDRQQDHLQAGMSPLDPGFGIEPVEQAGVFTTPDGTTHKVPTETGRWLDFYLGMKAAIETGAPVPVDARDAAEVIEIVELARQSARTGRRVALPPDPWR